MIATARLTAFSSGLVIGISLLVVAGWTLDVAVLKSVLPGYISMKANTAFMFCAMGITSLLLRRKTQKTGILLICRLLCALTAVLSLLTLSEYLFDSNLGIDEFFFKDIDGITGRFPPGRLAPITAVNFMLLSVSLFLTTLREKKHAAFSQFLVVVCLFAGLQSAIGYAIGMKYTFGSAFYTQMAVHTSVSFILLSIGILLSRPQVGFMKSITAKSRTAYMVRWLLAAVILIPPLTKLVSQKGLQAELFDRDFEVLIQVIANMVLTAFIVLFTAKKINDIDEERNGALALESESRAKAEKALLTRNHFLSIASHELKTPLMALQLQNELLQHQLEKRDLQVFTLEKLGKSAAASERQITWLHYLIKEMLDVSRIDSGKLVLNKKTIDIFPVAQQAIAEQVQFTQGRLQINLQGCSAIVSCDEFQIEQLFASLLSNAVKYGQQKPVEFNMRLIPQFVEIEVKDLGIGIALENQERIFERFERALSENEVSGLGLGLFIAKEIVTAHGGSISVKSLLTEGATFIVLLPRIS